jgi:hypothetical protein
MRGCRFEIPADFKLGEKIRRPDLKSGLPRRRSGTENLGRARELLTSPRPASPGLVPVVAPPPIGNEGA